MRYGRIYEEAEGSQVNIFYVAYTQQDALDALDLAYQKARRKVLDDFHKGKARQGAVLDQLPEV